VFEKNLCTPLNQDYSKCRQTDVGAALFCHEVTFNTSISYRTIERSEENADNLPKMNPFIY